MGNVQKLTAALAACLLLGGCSGMLDRSYESDLAHVDKPVTAEDPSVLRAENYQELVSAVLYLVSQGKEEGTIQLHNYPDDVEQALNTACLEVAKEDPLGAYAVDYIKHECSRVVSYHQADLSIRYRRTPEQLRSIVNVTGASAIRAELQAALAEFSGEAVLRVAYFAQDEETILDLVRQAYYDTPAAALGLPEVQVSLYPETGRERVVELLLTYPEEKAALERKSDALLVRAGTLTGPLSGLDPYSAALRVAELLKQETRYEPQAGSTAWDALMARAADSEGLALAYTLLARQCGVVCEVVEGLREGEPWFWNEVRIGDGEPLYLDCVSGDGRLHTAQELARGTYLWPALPLDEAQTAGES